MSHKRILIVISILAVDIFAAFAWLFFIESPYYVLREAQRHASDVTSVATTVSVTSQGKLERFHLADFLKNQNVSSTPLETSTNTRVIAAFDVHTLGSINSQMKFFSKIDQAPFSLAISADVLSRGDQRFVRFDADPENGTLQSNAVQKWVSLPPVSLQYPFLCADVSVPLSQDREKKLRDLFRATKFFSFKKRLPDTSENGQQMFHYSLAFRPDALRGFRIFATNLREERSLSDQELLEMTKEMQVYGVTDAEVWIGKRDYFVRRLLVRGEYKNTANASGTPFQIDAHVDSWNLPVEIDNPTSALPMSALLVSQNSGSLESAQESATGTVFAVQGASEKTGIEAAVQAMQVSEDADEDGLSDTLESFYRTDAWNPDTDGDGYTDGFEVNRGYNPTGAGTLFDFGT